MKPKLLIVPGLGDSKENHWQDIWLHQLPNTEKIVHDDWENPKLSDWLAQLQTTLSTIQEPTLLIAHSLGAILVAHWSNTFQNHWVKGALLVAPADVDSKKHTPACIWNFAPIPTTLFPFPTLVVGSENDPYMPLNRTEALAKHWGSRFVNCGAIGHINSDSDLGNWLAGQELLQSLIESVNLTNTPPVLDFEIRR